MCRPVRAFYFRLAARLGRSVAELLATVDSDELTEWMAAYGMGLLDDTKQLREIVDLAGANVAATIANVHRGPDSAAFKVLDFAFLVEKPERDLDEMEAALEAALLRRCGE